MFGEEHAEGVSDDQQAEAIDDLPVDMLARELATMNATMCLT